MSTTIDLYPCQTCAGEAAAEGRPYDGCEAEGAADEHGYDEEAERTAYHEAGHAIAAALCAVAWTEVRLVASGAERLEEGLDAWTEFVAEHYEETSPANRAFIAWAGPWAEARYLAPRDLWAALPETQTYGGESDMEGVFEYWQSSDCAPHETEERWARELDCAWPQVQHLAKRSWRKGVVRTKYHPLWTPKGSPDPG